jgi:hypothetical protein
LKRGWRDRGDEHQPPGFGFYLEAGLIGAATLLGLLAMLISAWRWLSGS